MDPKQETEEQLRQRLTPEQYRVTQQNGTERPFTGEYYKTETDGTYRCVVCDEPLFESDSKFDSKSGWPSFYKPRSDEAIASLRDSSLMMVRTEVRCKKCDAHLGHVFDDAPQTPTGLRYCINSASLKLDPKENE